MAKAAVKMVTAKEAAKLAGIGDKGLRRYIRAGKIKATKVDGNWLVALNDLDAFIKALAEKPARGGDKIDVLVCPICEAHDFKLPENEYGEVIQCRRCEGSFVYRQKHIDQIDEPKA